VNTILLAAIDLTTILPFALFGAVALGMWVVADTFMGGRSKTESRLERINNRTAAVTETSGTKDNIQKLLAKASPKISESMKPKSEASLSSMRQTLSEAGYRSDSAVASLVTLKTIGLVLGVVLGGGLSLLLNGLDTWTLLYTVCAAGVGFYGPEMVVVFQGMGRKQKVFLGLPDALDLMVVCVEAGLGMDQAMRRVSEELVKTHPVIATEFNICNQQLQMGKPREAVLNELGDRNGVDDLRTLASVMIQVDKFGTSVGRALRTQSDSMRVRRRQIAEEKAAKTAVKMIFPLVLFIFPGVFVVLVGPAAITMVREMMPMMTGG
jgi:tight adherence protein C